MSYLIKFRAVGRSKSSFDLETDSLDEFVLERFIRERHVLINNSIKVILDEDKSGGIIVVGGFRIDGRFDVVDLSEKALSE